MKEVEAIKDFFWNGILITKNEIIEVNKVAFKQLVNEEHLCQIKTQKGEEAKG